MAFLSAWLAGLRIKGTCTQTAGLPQPRQRNWAKNPPKQPHGAEQSLAPAGGCEDRAAVHPPLSGFEGLAMQGRLFPLIAVNEHPLEAQYEAQYEEQPFLKEDRQRLAPSAKRLANEEESCDRAD